MLRLLHRPVDWPVPQKRHAGWAAQAVHVENCVHGSKPRLHMLVELDTKAPLQSKPSAGVQLPLVFERPHHSHEELACTQRAHAPVAAEHVPKLAQAAGATYRPFGYTQAAVLATHVPVEGDAPQKAQAGCAEQEAHVV